MTKREREVPVWYYEQSGTISPGNIEKAKNEPLPNELRNELEIEAQLAFRARNSGTDWQHTKKK